MKRSEFIRMHGPTLRVLAKVCAYSVAMVVVLWASARWFGDSLSSHLSLLCLFTVLFESLCLMPGKLRFCQWRKTCYVLTLVALATFGLIFLSQANAVGDFPR